MARYTALFADETRRTGKFLAGAQLVVEAMLQSPNFLFLRNAEADTRQYEIASRLSYFLWDTMPDAELFDAPRAASWLPPQASKSTPAACSPIRARASRSMSSPPSGCASTAC